MGPSLTPARAASQTVIKNARVGSNPKSRLKLNCDTAVLSPALEEYTIHNASGAANGIVAVNAATSLLCFSSTATRMITTIDSMTGRISCDFMGSSVLRDLRDD